MDTTVGQLPLERMTKRSEVGYIIDIQEEWETFLRRCQFLLEATEENHLDIVVGNVKYRISTSLYKALETFQHAELSAKASNQMGLVRACRNMTYLLKLLIQKGLTSRLDNSHFTQLNSEQETIQYAEA